MLELIESIKAQAERDLLYAEAKIDVCNSLLAEARERESVCAADPEETVVDEQICVDTSFMNVANLQETEV